MFVFVRSFVRLFVNAVWIATLCSLKRYEHRGTACVTAARLIGCVSSRVVTVTPNHPSHFLRDPSANSRPRNLTTRTKQVARAISK